MIVRNSYIIVLGQRIERLGILPESLQNRIKVGLEVYKKEKKSIDRNVYLLLSGGDTSNIGQSEAEAMKEYILSEINKLDEMNREYNDDLNKDIILEMCSNNTIENALYCREIIQATASTCPCIDIHVVTNEFHSIRSECIFQSMITTLASFDEIKLCMHTSDSCLPKGFHRPVSDRPVNIPQWSLSERLELELLSVKNINKRLSSVDLAVFDTMVLENYISRLQKQLDVVKNSPQNDDNIE